jgi:mTERF domain-containing protein
MAEKDVSKVHKLYKSLLDKPSQDLEEGLELLSECGLTTPAQIRRAVLGNPGIFLYKSKRDLKSRLSYLRSIINKEDMCKLVYTDSKILDKSEDKLKSAISLLQRLGLEGEALSKLVARQPRLVMYAEEKVMESFKVAEGLGLEKGSQKFGHALRAILGIGQGKIDRKLQCLSSLGFSEKQIYKFSSRTPWLLGLSEEKLKRNVDFLVKSLGLPLDDIDRCPCLLQCNLERRIIPRYRVMEALKSMQLLKTERISPYIVKLTDKRFLEKYVNWNAESSSVLRDIYYGGKAGKVDH